MVDVVRVVEQPVDVRLSLPGELGAYQSVAIYPRVTGFVKTINVDRGARVRAGDVLAVLEAPELVAQRAEAQSKLQAAEAQLAAARARADSERGTFEKLKAASATPGVVAGNDLEHQGGVFDGVGERPDLIERRGEGEQAVAGDATVSGLESDDPAECRWLANGTAGVRTERQRRHAGRDCSRRATAAAARRARVVPGVPRCPGRRVLGRACRRGHVGGVCRPRRGSEPRSPSRPSRAVLKSRRQTRQSRASLARRGRELRWPSPTAGGWERGSATPRS